MKKIKKISGANIKQIWCKDKRIYLRSNKPCINCGIYDNCQMRKPFPPTPGEFMFNVGIALILGTASIVFIFKIIKEIINLFN